MTDDPPPQSTTTVRRSPDVVGSRPPKLDRGRALRRAAVAVAVIVAVALVLVLGRDDGGPTFTGPATDDPVSTLCRSSDDQQSAACSAAFFACRDDRARIVREAALPTRARPGLVVAAYVAGAWSDWDAPVQRSARRGCRKGLAG